MQRRATTTKRARANKKQQEKGSEATYINTNRAWQKRLTFFLLFSSTSINDGGGDDDPHTTCILASIVRRCEHNSPKPTQIGIHATGTREAREHKIVIIMTTICGYTYMYNSYLYEYVIKSKRLCAHIRYSQLERVKYARHFSSYNKTIITKTTCSLARKNSNSKDRRTEK